MVRIGVTDAAFPAQGVPAPNLPGPGIAQSRNPLEVIAGVWNSPLVHLTLLALGGLCGLLWLSLVYWAYKDARRRDYPALFAGALCLFVPFAGALLYGILRPPEYALDHEERELELAVLEKELRGGDGECRTCGQSVAASHLYCPHCGSALKRACAECGGALEDDYAYCPNCGARPSPQRPAAGEARGAPAGRPGDRLAVRPAADGVRRRQ